MQEEMEKVIKHILEDTSNQSVTDHDNDGYNSYKLALEYCKLVADMKEQEEKLKVEKAKLKLEEKRFNAEMEQKERFKDIDHTEWQVEQAQKQFNWEAERETAGNWKDKEYEMWLKDHQQRASYGEQELSIKKKSNASNILSAIGGVIVGVGSIAGGLYLGKKGLETDITSYNQSPNTLRQAESITASSTKYLN
jgi:hypothetical protein